MKVPSLDEPISLPRGWANTYHSLIMCHISVIDPFQVRIEQREAEGVWRRGILLYTLWRSSDLSLYSGQESQWMDHVGAIRPIRAHEGFAASAVPESKE